MNPLTENDAARSWSGWLGSLAAELPPVRPPTASTQFTAAAPAPLSAILARLRQRARTREHVAGQLRAKEFLLAP